MISIDSVLYLMMINYHMYYLQNQWKNIEILDQTVETVFGVDTNYGLYGETS